MQRRTFLGLLAVTPLIGLAACGDDSSSTPTTVPPIDSTLPEPDGFDHPTGPDDVVVRIGFEGGFGTPEMTYVNVPVVLVSGDGRLFQQGPVIAIYPGPLLPNIQERPISEAGIQQLLALADSAGLLQERTYERNDLIADAPDTVVTINADGQTFTHRAYALGLEDETDEARRALAQFVTDAQALVNGPESDVVGPEKAFEPDTYLIRALIAGDWAGAEGDPEPRVVEWPAEASVSLAGEPECVEVPADEFGGLFAEADQLTWFAEDGISYQVFVKPRLPGDSC
jgi:hypothetical protein